MSRTTDAWNKVRGAGGSIIGPDGDNWTSNADGAADFEASMKEWCSNAGKLHDALTAMEDAATQAAQMAAMNALPTTKPKCYSKPIVRLLPGCDVEWNMVARNNQESDCSS